MVSIPKSAIRNLKSKILWGVFLVQVTGRFNKNKTWPLLDDRTWDDMPVFAGIEGVQGSHPYRWESQIKM